MYEAVDIVYAPQRQSSVQIKCMVRDNNLHSMSLCLLLIHDIQVCNATSTSFTQRQVIAAQAAERAVCKPEL